MAGKKNPTRHRANAEGLTPREATFVAAYCVTVLNTNGKGNATEAAIAAGSPTKSAATYGSNMMRKPPVRAAIDKRLDARLNQFEVTETTIIQELAKLGFANMANYLSFGKDGCASIDWSNLTPEQAAAIGEVTIDTFDERNGVDDEGKPTFEKVRRIRFKLADKKGPLELLGKYKKLFVDRSTMENPDGTAMQPMVMRVEFVDSKQQK